MPRCRVMPCMEWLGGPLSLASCRRVIKAGLSIANRVAAVAAAPRL